jgi:hypothetical protein
VLPIRLTRWRVGEGGQRCRSRESRGGEKRRGMAADFVKIRRRQTSVSSAPVFAQLGRAMTTRVGYSETLYLLIFGLSRPMPM